MKPVSAMVLAVLACVVLAGCMTPRYADDPEVDKAVRLFLEACPNFKKLTLYSARLRKNPANHFTRVSMRWHTQVFLGAQDKSSKTQHHVDLGGPPSPGVVFYNRSTADLCGLSQKVRNMGYASSPALFYPIPGIEITAPEK